MCIRKMRLLSRPSRQREHWLWPNRFRNAPKLLSDKRHKWMQDFQNFIANISDRRTCFALSFFVDSHKDRFGKLQVPIAIKVPDKLICDVGSFVETIVA